MDWIREENDYHNSYTYTKVMKHHKTEEEAKSMALRFLIHYLGDIHQPLHCMTRVNPDFPHGDKGGNAFELKSHYRVYELHALWDSVMYAYHDSIKLVYAI